MVPGSFKRVTSDRRLHTKFHEELTKVTGKVLMHSRKSYLLQENKKVNKKLED